MMKKSLLTLAAIAALTSCSQDDLMNNTDSQASDAIGVNVFVPTASRGTAYNSTADFNKNGSTFDLFAVKCMQENDYSRFMGSNQNDNGEYTDLVEFIYNKGWDYEDDSEIHFWKEAAGSTVTFYAVAPANPTIKKRFKLTDYQKLEYTVSKECSKQVDLMYATATVEVDKDGNPKQDGVDCKDGVNLEFKHALSQILFKAKTEHSKLYANIESIDVNNVYSKGTFTYSDSNWTLTDDNGVATYNTYTAALKNNTNIPNTATEISESPLLLLPQKLRDSDLQPNLSIKYAIYYKEGENIQSIKVFEDLIEVPLTGSWNAGYKYTYTLIFSNELANPIKIGTVNVDDWTDGGDNDTTLNDSNN